MTYLQALVLGLLQGLTEFLPVSSSGHLQGIPFLLGWDSASLGFDVLVHTGTLLAVVIYFRHDLWSLASGALGLGDTGASERRQAWLLIGLLAVGSVPAALAGLLFNDFFESTFDSPRMVAGFLYLTAALLWFAEHLRARRAAVVGEESGASATQTTTNESAPEDGGSHPRNLTPHSSQVGDRDDVEEDGFGGSVMTADDVGRGFWTVRGRDAVVIGIAQALAIFPGVSRAGATIAAGMAVGLSRTAAARFSFLLSIPIILGATIFTLSDLGTAQPGALAFGAGEIAVGLIASAASGYWAIRFLLRLVVRRDLLGFARYVTVFGTVLLIATFVLP